MSNNVQKYLTIKFAICQNLEENLEILRHVLINYHELIICFFENIPYDIMLVFVWVDVKTGKFTSAFFLSDNP